MSIVDKVKKFGRNAVLALAASACFAMPAKTEAKEPVKAVSYVKKLDVSGLELKLNNSFQSKNVNIITKKTNQNIQFSYNDWLFKLFVELPTYSAVSFVSTVTLHELGHAADFKLLGCNDVRFKIFQDGNVASVGCLDEQFSEQINNYERNLISAVGVENTTNLSHFLYQSIKTDSIPKKLKPLFATMALFAMFDRHRYLWSGAIRHYLRQQSRAGHDFMNMMNTMFDKQPKFDGVYAASDGLNCFYNDGESYVSLKKGHLYEKNENGEFREVQGVYADDEGKWRERFDKNNYPHYVLAPCEHGNGSCVYSVNPNEERNRKIKDVAYGIALGMSVIELGLRFNEIKYLVNTALGYEPEPPKGFDVIKAGFYPIKNGFFVSIDGVHDWF